MNKLKIGMISFAHSHANSYLRELMSRDDVEVAGICDDDRRRVEHHLNAYGIPFFSDHRSLLAADIDAVVICSENVHHAALTIDAANAGKHVLCEKPLGIEVGQMQDMIAACKENGVQLMTAFPCRYLAAVMEAKAAVEQGEIGRILAIKGTNRGTMPGRWFVEPALSGGGAVMDHTVHVMDLMSWFLQSEPVEVYAEAGRLFHDDLEVDDAGMVNVKFANGVTTVLDTSWSRAKAFPVGGDVTMQIIGTEGIITVDALAQRNELYANDKSKSEWSYWGDGMDRYMVDAFVRSILEGTEVPITGEDGLRSAAVALAAYESVKRGETVAFASLFTNRKGAGL